MRVYDRRDRPHPVLIEPWALTYVIPAGGEMTVTAKGSSASSPCFEVAEWDGMTQLFCEGAEDYVVEPAGLEPTEAI